MLYMIIETFRGGDALPVYRRFRAEGRLAPDGLRGARGKRGRESFSLGVRTGKRLPTPFSELVCRLHYLHHGLLGAPAWEWFDEDASDCLMRTWTRNPKTCVVVS